MTPLQIPIFVWGFTLCVVFLTGFVGICMGTPGNSRIKKALIRFGVFWIPLPVLDGMIQYYIHYGSTPPVWVTMGHALAFQVYMMVGAEMFYSVAEKNRNGMFWFAHLVCGTAFVLIPFFEALYAFESEGRILISMLSLLVITGACLSALYVSFRQSDRDSNRRKRIRLIFLGASTASFVFYMPWAVGETLGWWSHRALFASVMHLSIVSLMSIILSFVVLKYNLVKVELDDVGEGLFRDIEAPVLLLSKDLQILRSNPKADEVFGVDALKGRSGSEPTVQELVPGFQSGMSQFDVAMDSLQGPKEFQCKLSDVYQVDEVLGSILVFHDVTRERELARMKTEFTSTVSHELRTPLTSILGFARLIQRRFGDVVMDSWTPETKKQNRAVKQINSNLDVIISESNRLTKLINDVLDISKMEAGKIHWNFAQMDIRSITDQAINATHGLFAAKPGVQLVQKIPDALAQVVADSDRVIQVIINLISNAVKFTDSGQITIQVEQAESRLIVKVQDQGSGISEADQKLVFEKYKQVGDVITDKPTGTGLGLPISKEIVEMHGGQIWVESTLGEGSTFAFSLPLATVVDAGFESIDIADLISQLQSMTATDSGEQSTVLVIDDDTAIRDMLVQMLEEAGLQALEASDGVEGLEVARSERPDVIILDVMMPRLNGFDCAAALKGDPKVRHIPIIMLTVLDDVQRAFGLGVEAYISKPFDEQKVLSEIQRLLCKRQQRRRVLVLGPSKDSRPLLQHLSQIDVETHHLEDLDALASVLSENDGPDVALVVGEDFQEPQIRIQIQKMVGVHPCLVLYANSDRT